MTKFVFILDRRFISYSNEDLVSDGSHGIV